MCLYSAHTPLTTLCTVLTVLHYQIRVLLMNVIEPVEASMSITLNGTRGESGELPITLWVNTHKYKQKTERISWLEVSGSMNDEKHVDRYQKSPGEKIYTSLLTVSADLGHLTSVGLVWRVELVWSSWLRRVRNIMTWDGSDQPTELSVWRICIKSGEKQEKWANDKTPLIIPRYVITVFLSCFQVQNIPKSRYLLVKQNKAACL